MMLTESLHEVDMRERILKALGQSKRLTSSVLAKRLGISRQAIHRHLTTLLQQGMILKEGTSRKTTVYLLARPPTRRGAWKDRPQFKKRYPNVGLEEGRVLTEVKTQRHVLNHLSPKVQALFRYAFTEILNNAIDHSQSPFVDIAMTTTPGDVVFIIADRGVGIFENIREKKGLASEMEALQDLLKGKQTTAPEEHSGEGIFFTSKVADRLVIESHKKELIIDNRIDDLFVRDIAMWRGTRVTFTLSQQSTKTLDDIFRQYTDEEFQFSKSRVVVKLFKEGEEYISRSQAKRLLHTLERFSEIVVDFKGITTIGQGFADEVFRVFPSHHPGIVMTPVNCHENVEFMINRAKALEAT